jgi:hypothetical protein
MRIPPRGWSATLWSVALPHKIYLAELIARGGLGEAVTIRV